MLQEPFFEAASIMAKVVHLRERQRKKNISTRRKFVTVQVRIIVIMGKKHHVPQQSLNMVIGN